MYTDPPMPPDCALFFAMTSDAVARDRTLLDGARRCWNNVSGGVPDGDAKHPDYRYGGLWKAKR